ncbi:MAG: F420-dependent oxidoreductase [Acidimicrobiales bacterium]|nr:F420-dependent oxidoreductase [Acidimicrobiales bacterium]
MDVFTTTPVPDLAGAGSLFAELEAVGYDGAFSYETKHDPFLPLALAADRTTSLRLGTAIAIAFARTPMLLATLARDLQDLSRGRMTLGLGSQIRPHITKRYSMPWSRPADRMRELVLGIRAIWDAWDGIAPLDFRGEFYTHTLLPPAFDPGPHEHGRARIHVAGVGPRMVAVAGEVADGLITHPFATRRSLEEQVLPALGRKPEGFEVVVVCMVATGATGADLDEAIATVRGQLAFYGSTPAYAPVLELEGYGDLHPRLNALSKQGRWDDMAELVPDDLLEAIAVVGRRDEIATRVRERTAGIADAVSLECTRRPDPAHFADIVADLKGLA